jgi:hypothetical protein
MIEFMICNDPTCSHCPNVPVSAHYLLSRLRRIGNQMPTPTFSDLHRGHYMTALEYLAAVDRGRTPTPPDQGLPSIVAAGVKRCHRGCNMVLTSKVDGEHHDLL